MKKMLALTLIVIISVGFAVPASAASPLYKDGSTFNFTIDGYAAATPTSFSATDPLATATSGSIILIRDIRAFVGDSNSSQLLADTEYTLAATITAGGDYASLQPDDTNKRVALTLTNNTASDKTVTVQISLTPVSGASNLSQSGFFTATFTAKSATNPGATYNLTWANGGLFPLNANYKVVTLPVGGGPNEFSAIDAAVISHLRSISDGLITVQGPDYELAFAAGTVGATTNLVDIDGQRGVPSAFSQMYPGVPSYKLAGISGLSSNSAIATFTLQSISQDFLDLYQGLSLYIYDANGNLTSFQAHWAGDRIVFTAPVGSYVVTGDVLTPVDTTPPTLVDVTVSPATVDLPGRLDFTITATDDISGVSTTTFLLIFYSPTDPSTGLLTRLRIYGGSLSPLGNNRYSGHTILENHIPVDTYTLVGVQLFDNAGNDSRYGLGELPLPLSRSFTTVITTLQESFSTLDTGRVAQFADNTPGGVVRVGMPLREDTLPRALFEAVQGKDVTLILESTIVQMVYKGADITAGNVKDLQTGSTFGPLGSYTGTHASDIRTLAGDPLSYVVAFPSNGLLPGPCLVRVKVDDDFLQRMGEEEYFIYYYNSTTHKLELLPSKGVLSVDGYVEFSVTHHSEYLISKDQLAPAGISSDGEWITLWGGSGSSETKNNPRTGR